ncbi:MAG: LPS assembly lipoprotein LptE [Thermoanaerobaculia bacterium]|nr:LPS assembly lipoprotein LptE [Thermoanaerobaculia bacterium]
MKRTVLAFAAGAAAVWLGGCGYRLAGSGRGTLPESAASISVPTFTNETIRVGLEQRVTDAVLRELAARTKLKPVQRGQEGDVELIGKLLNYAVVAVRFDPDGRALEYEISMTASVKLVDKKEDKVLFENPFFLYREPYNVPPASNYSDVESSAIDNLARPFARSLVTTILEGF